MTTTDEFLKKMSYLVLSKAKDLFEECISSCKEEFYLYAYKDPIYPPHNDFSVKTVTKNDVLCRLEIKPCHIKTRTCTFGSLVSITGGQQVVGGGMLYRTSCVPFTTSIREDIPKDENLDRAVTRLASTAVFLLLDVQREMSEEYGTDPIPVLDIGVATHISNVDIANNRVHFSVHLYCGKCD